MTAQGTADLFDIKFRGSFKPGEGYALVQARDRNMRKVPAKKAVNKREGLCLDTKYSHIALRIIYAVNHGNKLQIQSQYWIL
jgi:hypothetical protein